MPWAVRLADPDARLPLHDVQAGGAVQASSATRGPRVPARRPEDRVRKQPSDAGWILVEQLRDLHPRDQDGRAQAPHDARRCGHVPDLVSSLTTFANGDLTTAVVPWGGSPHSLSVRGKINDEPHLHDNTFQHGAGPDVGPRLELAIDPLVPRDRFCVASVQADCMKVVAKPGSKMARFLGSAVDYLAGDHEVLSHV